MRIRKLVLLASVVALPAFAQVQISVQLPTVSFSAPPPLVVVQPGVQVVENHEEEVFFVDNFYWVRRGPNWYRARDHRGGWAVVEGPRVPASIVRLPVGQYRHYKHEVREERREERRELEGKGQVHKEKHDKH